MAIKLDFGAIGRVMATIACCLSIASCSYTVEEGASPLYLQGWVPKRVYKTRECLVLQHIEDTNYYSLNVPLADGLSSSVSGKYSMVEHGANGMLSNHQLSYRWLAPAGTLFRFDKVERHVVVPVGGDTVPIGTLLSGPFAGTQVSLVSISRDVFRGDDVIRGLDPEVVEEAQ